MQRRASRRQAPGCLRWPVGGFVTRPRVRRASRRIQSPRLALFHPRGELQFVRLIADSDEAIIFDEDHDTKWERALATLGVRADQLSAQVGHA